MLKLILVPLDGSAFGEQALPTALRIAERERAELELVHVYESIPPSRTIGAPALDPRLDNELRKDRSSYLDAVAARLRRQTTAPVAATILEGPVGLALANHIAARGVDLVVMATHGRGGLSRVWLGSVASELIRVAGAPLLLMRPDESGSRTLPAHPFRRVLIPLDGSPAGDEALEHAVAIAGDVGVEYLLLHVLTPILYIGEPTNFADPDESEMEAAAEAYLGDVADRIRVRGFTVDTRILRHTQPARGILEVAEESEVDLIAMETHGRSGVARLVMGSVADKVVRASPIPVLLHRPRFDEAQQPMSGESGERRASGTVRS